MKTLKDGFLEALRSPTPASELRRVVRERALAGRTAAEISHELESLLVRLRGEPTAGDADEELLLDLLDAIAGWCHPTAALFADQKSF